MSELMLEAPLDWRIAAGHRLVELENTDADVVDVWVLNIWKAHGHQPPAEAVDAWHAVGAQADADAAAGIHPHLSRQAWWVLTYAETWNRLMKGVGDIDALKVEGSVRYEKAGTRDPTVLEHEEFDGLTPADKKYYRELPDRPKWIPPTT